MAMVKPANASGSVSTFIVYSMTVWGVTCTSADLAVFAACVTSVENANGQQGGCWVPPGSGREFCAFVGSEPGWAYPPTSLVCPANSTGTPATNPTTCTCSDPYVPDSTGTSCVLANYCPANMSGSPCACIPGGYVFISDEAGCVQEQFTISEPKDQTKIPDVEPGSTAEITVRVTSVQTSQPKQGAVVRFHIDADITSGGHDHGEENGRRPRGTISSDNCVAESGGTPDTYDCTTGPQGYTGFTFNAPDVSGTQTITATCISAACSGSITSNIDVKVGGLWPIPDSVYYSLTEDGSSKVIGSTTNHTSNHYLTSAASMKLWRLAADFYNYQVLNGVMTPTLLHLNDASLKWGGVFDLDADWDEPHAEHRRGTVIDVRANSSPGAIPDADFSAFKAMAKLLKVDPHFEGGSINQHFHLRLLNRKE